MMDEILLTPDDIEREFKEAQAAFKRESNGHLRWAGFWQNWLLRAQLRKVVDRAMDIMGEWENPLATRDENADDVLQCAYDRGINDEDILKRAYDRGVDDVCRLLQSLRAAAEEARQ